MAISIGKTKKNINDILENTIEIQFNKIEENINDYCKISEKILKDLFSIFSQDDIDKKEELLEKLRSENNSDIDFIETIIINHDRDSISNKAKYELLKHNYYKIKNDLLEIKNDILSKRMDNYSTELNDNRKKFNCLEIKF